MTVTLETVAITSISFFVLYILFKKLLKTNPSALSTNKSIIICPKCASTDCKQVYTGRIRKHRNISNKYKCSKCNYTGIFPIIDSDKAKKLKRDIEEVKKSL
ncbi:hypothetical protein HOD20_05230 [archaeon]|jgi:transposase-like protein|nr:hypothetical protein [archaeon]MBT4351907.1 hypothetical protein [archaeon]MBT4648371.1 hypothetical protein [archaeon]MBT6821562.1 hypothetical protein [archaeon]MBT7391608.1 hypothetical protein [archaeon]